MTLQQLEYLVAIEQMGSFTKAAQKCSVTQPTLSAMIQKLEEEFDVKLFDRTKQPVEFTPIGLIFLEQAKKLLQQASGIRDYIDEERHAISGTFTIGILPTIAPYLLPRFFPELVKKYPQLDIRIVEMKTDDIKNALKNRTIDAGIVAHLTDMSDFNVRILFYEQFFAYISENEPIFANQTIKTSDLHHQQLWMLDEGHCFRDQLVKFCSLSGAANSQRIYKLGSMETFMRMVESGIGTTFIPELAIEQFSEPQKKLIRPFAIPIPTRQIVLLTNQDFVRESILNVLTEAMRTAVPESMRSKRATQQII